MTAPRLSIVIVNWNSGTQLRDCLTTVQRETRSAYEVLVVDNASHDGSAAGVDTEFPYVDVMPSAVNLGFAAGTNLALPRTRGEFIVLLNPDTLVTQAALDRLADFLANHPRAGAAGPHLPHPNGRYHVRNGGWQPSIGSVFAHYSGLSRVLPSMRGLHTTRPVTQRVGWLSGACLVVRRAALDSAGPLHEGWFMYAEDVEWCDRIGRDWELWYVPAVKVVHFDRQSTKQRGRPFSTLWAVGLHRHYVRRARPGRAALLVFDAVMAAGLLSRACLYAARAALARRREPWWPEALNFAHGARDLMALGLAGPRGPAA